MVYTADVLNTEVSPNISIRQHWSDRRTTYSEHTYYDPTDDVRYSADGLTKAEKGYFINYSPRTDHILIELPYRIACKELVMVLGSCGAKTHLISISSRTNSGKAAHAERATLSEGLNVFSLPIDKLDNFIERTQRLGWVSRDVSITEEEFTSVLEQKVSTLREYITEWDYLRTSVRNEDIDLTNRGTYYGILDRIETLATQRRGVGVNKQYTISGNRSMNLMTIQRLINQQPNSTRINAVNNHLCNQVSNLNEALVAFDSDRLIREVTHARDVAEGRVANPIFDSLEDELAFLSNRYPVLKRLTGAGKTVEIDLTYVTVILHEDRVEVAGDVTKLASFSNYQPTSSSKDSTAKRFSSVLKPKTDI
jgi:hypothetical protein